MMETMRLWQQFMEQGKLHSQHAELEQALLAFNSALSICESSEISSTVSLYRNLVLGEIGHVNRQFGRYAQAKDILEGALKGISPSTEHIRLSIELGVVYRHMNRLADAKHTLEVQSRLAKNLGLERERSRAIGNLGIVNYQLFLQDRDYTLLDLAIEQLIEGIQSARRLKRTDENQSTSSKVRDAWFQYCNTRESIGLTRLSWCYTARGDAKEAISAASGSVSVAKGADNPTILATSSLHYGRTLLANGEGQKASMLFHSAGVCSPAVAFLFKEPSDEHHLYLREAIEGGVNAVFIDEHGYTALDYAVFNGDQIAEKLVLRGLRYKFKGKEQLESILLQRLSDAKLRKHYREIFQEKHRPVLLGSSGGRSDKISNMRRAYASTLGMDQEKRSLFDGFKMVSYIDFVRFQRLPRSTGNLT